MIVELESTTRAFALDSISRVDVKGDSIKDGAIGHVLWRPAGRHTFPDVRESLSGVVEFGLIGLGLDALHSHERTVYKAPVGVHRDVVDRAAGVSVSVATAGPGRNGSGSPVNQARCWSP
jgi:hypothetical protein